MVIFIHKQNGNNLTDYHQDTISGYYGTMVGEAEGNEAWHYQPNQRRPRGRPKDRPAEI